MKVIVDNYKVKPTEKTCPHCKSVLLFDQTDLHKDEGNWVRTGIEESKRTIREYIVCPLCKKEIVIKKWTEEF